MPVFRRSRGVVWNAGTLIGNSLNRRLPERCCCCATGHPRGAASGLVKAVASTVVNHYPKRCDQIDRNMLSAHAAAGGGIPGRCGRGARTHGRGNTRTLEMTMRATRMLRALVLTACALASAAPTPARATDTVVLGTVGSASANLWPVFIGLDK